MPTQRNDNLKKLDYKTMKRWLNQGDITALAMRKKIPRATAYKILSGQTRNFEFLQAAYEVAIDNATKFKQLQEKLNSINN